MLQGSYYSFIKGHYCMTFCVFVEDVEQFYLLTNKLIVMVSIWLLIMYERWKIGETITLIKLNEYMFIFFSCWYINIEDGRWDGRCVFCAWGVFRNKQFSWCYPRYLLDFLRKFLLVD